MLSWLKLTTLIEGIKLSTDIIDETASVYRGRLGEKKPYKKAFFNLLNDKELAHTHTYMHYIYLTCLSLQEAGRSGVFTQCCIVMQICVSKILFFFSLHSQAFWQGPVSMAHQVRGTSSAVDRLIQMLMLVQFHQNQTVYSICPCIQFAIYSLSEFFMS